MLRPGTVVLAQVQFVDRPETKIRPALILFEEFDNVVIAGITSNTEMQGITLTKKEGAIKDSVIKLNYIFTVTKIMILKNLFELTPKKKKLVFDELVKKLEVLK